MILKSVRFILLCFLFLWSISGFSQDNIQKVKEQKEETVKAKDLDQLPYPDKCKTYLDNPVQLRNCSSDYISRQVSKNYNKKTIDGLNPGKYTVYVQFKIDKEGKVVDVKARTNDANTILEEEAIRMVKQIPQMNPGLVDGEAVNVAYGVPLNFVVPKKKKKKKKR